MRAGRCLSRTRPRLNSQPLLLTSHYTLRRLARLLFILLGMKRCESYLSSECYSEWCKSTLSLPISTTQFSKCAPNWSNVYGDGGGLLIISGSDHGTMLPSAHSSLKCPLVWIFWKCFLTTVLACMNLRYPCHTCQSDINRKSNCFPITCRGSNLEPSQIRPLLNIHSTNNSSLSSIIQNAS